MSDDSSSRVRTGISAMSVGNILAGASQLVRGTWPQTVLLGLATVVMALTAAWVIGSNRASGSTAA